MKANLLKYAPLCLLLCWMLPVDSMTIHSNLTPRDANQEVQSIPLSMVEDSVDDMYFGCMEPMMELVKQKYPKSEESNMHLSRTIQERCDKKKPAQTEDKGLTKDHIQAICVYTSNEIYEKFNHAVRTEGSNYTSSFHFHSLHFLLTSAIMILNSNYKCHTTYRRTNVIFTGRVGQRIRFGSFASSSYRNNLTDFGNKTCFKIRTCSGAPLKKYSVFEGEEEVLIPPYETFSIVEIFEGQFKIQDLNDCEIVYVLKSDGIRTKLNCKLFQ